MIGRLRRKLRLIRYYSAARPQTAWTRAQDFAFVLSLVLAFPMAWMGNSLIGREELVLSVGGQLVKGNNDDRVQAALTTSAVPPGFWAQSTPIGIFSLEVYDLHMGWPLTTQVKRLPPKLNLHVRSDGVPRPNAHLAPDDPIRVAIAETLERDGHGEVAQAWPATAAESVSSDQHWIAWILATGIWWIMLAIGSAAAIGIARFGSLLVLGKEAARRAQFRSQGKCMACGYDMTGLEFNERCPECGELVW